MSSDNTYRDKVDVIDFIINVLREHEKGLDELVGKLSKVLDRLPAAERAEVVERPQAIYVEIHDWGEFRSRCSGAEAVAFEIDGKVLSICAEKGGMVYTYSEELPEMRIRVRRSEDVYIVEEFSMDSLEDIPLAFGRRLKCGLEGAVRSSKVRVQEGVYLINIAFDVDVESAKYWLSRELKVDKGNIVQGKITV